jgi:hypothetical protein
MWSWSEMLIERTYIKYDVISRVYMIGQRLSE